MILLQTIVFSTNSSCSTTYTSMNWCIVYVTTIITWYRTEVTWMLKGTHLTVILRVICTIGIWDTDHSRSNLIQYQRIYTPWFLLTITSPLICILQWGALFYQGFQPMMHP